MNNQYITSITIDGTEYAGPIIEASSFKDAVNKVDGVEIIIVGQLEGIGGYHPDETVVLKGEPNNQKIDSNSPSADKTE